MIVYVVYTIVDQYGWETEGVALAMAAAEQLAQTRLGALYPHLSLEQATWKDCPIDDDHDYEHRDLKDATNLEWAMIRPFEVIG